MPGAEPGGTGREDATARDGDEAIDGSDSTERAAVIDRDRAGGGQGAVHQEGAGIDGRGPGVGVDAGEGEAYPCRT